MECFTHNKGVVSKHETLVVLCLLCRLVTFTYQVELFQVTGKPSGFKLKIKIGRSKEVKSVAHPENALAMGSSSRSVSVSPSHRELKM